MARPFVRVTAFDGPGTVPASTKGRASVDGGVVLAAAEAARRLLADASRRGRPQPARVHVDEDAGALVSCDTNDRPHVGRRCARTRKV